ncbi:putative pyrroloquinoline-quinone binding quinoprotein [Promicromonospora sp. AC04]|nr:putative pyrroloquinoline-quinone binding quinoprotein [Promicromonospora sp. AC04]
MRAVAPVAAVLAIVLGTGLAAEGAQDNARIERMRDVHGGVADVSSPLRETWKWEGLVGSRRAIEEGRGNEVAVLGDVLVFESDGELVALRPATGEEVWTVPLGEAPDCGPLGAAGWEETTTPALVCLAGSGANREVTVVGPDGVASAPRLLGAADTKRYGEPRPGPDGTVLRAKREASGPAVSSGDAVCTDTGECTGTVEAGRDLVLRAEDAVTGEERWSVTVPFRATRADQCNNWLGTSWDGSGNMVDLEQMLDPGAFGARIQGTLVQLYGCGIEAAVTPDGVPLGMTIEPGTGGVNSLVAGGYTGFTFDDTVRTVLYAADGEVVGEITGHALEPGVTDGSGPGTLLATDSSGRRLRAYESDGTPRWVITTRADAQLFLALVGGTAMVMTEVGTVRGLDAATGAERWVWDGSDDVGGGYLEDLFVSRAFTDGQSALLLTEDGAGGAGLVALDVASGEVVWEQHGDEAVTGGTAQGFDTALVAVDGNLLEVTPSGVRGLG